MLQTRPLVLKRPYPDLRARLDGAGMRPPSDPVWMLLLAAVFAAAAAFGFLAVVILGTPGSESPARAPVEVRLKVASACGPPAAQSLRTGPC